MKIKDFKESKIAENQWNRYTRARDAGHLDYCDTAKKCDAFYRGDQWDESDRAKLDAEGRPALTINTILSTVNTVLGHQASQRADILFKPRKGANQDLADTVTKLFGQIWDNNDMDFQEAQVFSDGIIQDRGYFDVRIDFDDAEQGEIRVSVEDPLDILPDPDAKNYDPATWQEVFKTRFLSLDEVAELYGQKKADELDYVAKSGAHYGRDSFTYREKTEGFGDTDLENWRSEVTMQEEENAVRTVRVVERQHRKLVDCDFFVRPDTGDMRMVPGHIDKQSASDFAEANGYTITSKKARRVRWTVTADRCLLYDDWSPYTEFTIVPYFPFFRRGKPFGMVRNLLSPQEMLNKVSSQELHIVNTTANSGWVVENGSLSNMDEDDLAERGAETGLVLVHNRGSEPPSKIAPNQIPTGLDRVSTKAQLNIKEISGVSAAMLGQDSPEVSGVAIEKKKQAGAVQIQIPMENLKRTRQIVARRVLDLVQNFYTEQRVVFITNEEDPKKPREQMEVNVPDPSGRVVNDITLGEYDIIVTSAPARDNFDDVQFAQAVSLRTAGVMVPDDFVVEYSSLHKKGELASAIRKLQGRESDAQQMQIQQLQQQMAIQGAQLELAKQEAEIVKMRADAELSIAKARHEGVRPELELQRIDTELEQRQEELATRAELSQMSNETSIINSQISAASKSEGNRTTLSVAEINAKQKLAQEALKQYEPKVRKQDDASSSSK